MALFGELGVGQALAGVFEVGAGVLPVRVQEECVELIAQVVVMRHIAARGGGGVFWKVAPHERLRIVDRLHEPRRLHIAKLAQDDQEEVVDLAFLDYEAPLGEELAEAQGRVGGETPLRARVHELHPNLRPGSVAEMQRFALGGDHGQIADFHRIIEGEFEKRFHSGSGAGGDAL